MPCRCPGSVTTEHMAPEGTVPRAVCPAKRTDRRMDGTSLVRRRAREVRNSGTTEQSPGIFHGPGTAQRVNHVSEHPVRQACHGKDPGRVQRRPDNTVSSIARLLGVSRATIYKYIPEIPARTQPAAGTPPFSAEDSLP
jgi:hypothetical protein